ncbi:hypothetical protein [Celeribacter halophilus]
MSYDYCPKLLHIVQIAPLIVLISKNNTCIYDDHQHHQRLLHARATV